VRFAVDGFGCLCARCLEQAEDLALVLIEPVSKGLRFIVLLGFEVLLVVLAATASAVSPSRFLWWSIYRGIMLPLLTPSPAGRLVIQLYPEKAEKARVATSVR
jgi:hypothetical protein